MEELEQLKALLAAQRPDRWEDLPDIPLYMDQVIGYLPRQMVAYEEGDSLTSAMINNYVKDGLLARAKGKKYDQEHLGYLIAISALKQVLSVREMQALVELSKENRPPERLYNYFCDYLDEALLETAEQLDTESTDRDLPKVILRLALRSYTDGLACRRALGILARRAGKAELLEKKKK